MEKLKKAIVLFNLGGPSNLNTVEPFLFKLFNDKAILDIINPFRFLLAKLISKRRLSYAKKIYEQIGGKSPILELTYEQAKALELLLTKTSPHEYKVFVVMRYSPPFADDVMIKIQDYAPHEVILLPLYPQFSTTTTASSLSHWYQLAEQVHLNITTKAICCFPINQGLINAYAELIMEKYQMAVSYGEPIILFSAHGIPLNRVQAGDPYEMQIHQTTDSIVQKLNLQDIQYKICYQSKVGPLKWLSPDTRDEIIEASQQSKPIIVVPIAFVSEHSETLVELDIMYKQLAEQNGCPGYFRVSAVGTHPKFIEGLANICLNMEQGIGPDQDSRPCSPQFPKCMHNARSL